MEKYGMRFEDMTKKEKVNHIWEYYKWHIIGTIITVVMAVSIGKAMLFPAPPDDVDIVVAAQMYTNLNSDAVIKEFKEKYQTGLDLTTINWNDAETAFVMIQKLPLMVSTEEMDIIAVSVETYDKFIQMYGTDMFTPLDIVPELSDLLEKYESQLVKSDFILDEEGNKVPTEEHVYGIKVDKLSNIPCIEAHEEIIVGLTSRVKDLDKTVTMLKYILE